MSSQRCPQCGRTVPREAAFCPFDGARLDHAAGIDRTHAATPAPSPAVASGQAGGAGTEVAASDGLAPGTLLGGRFRLREEVARGGSARVLAAIDQQTQQAVAVKVLLPELEGDPVAIERLQLEYELGRRLDSPYLVRSLALLELQPAHWALVMEYLEGEDLAAALAREHTLSPERLVRLVSQVALALQVAHAARIVHRDLKPDNLFLCGSADSESVKVLDFGSARDNARRGRRLTALGTTIGSPLYMAPEQARGASGLDRRVDVWALGAIAYEALTGQVPFAGETGAKVLQAILQSEPLPPSETPGGAALSTAVDQVLAAALTKSPRHRTQAPELFAEDLGRAFGLRGDVRQWATADLAQLRALRGGRPGAHQRFGRFASAVFVGSAVRWIWLGTAAAVIIVAGLLAMRCGQP